MRVGGWLYKGRRSVQQGGERTEGEGRKRRVTKGNERDVRDVRDVNNGWPFVFLVG